MYTETFIPASVQRLLITVSLILMLMLSFLHPANGQTTGIPLKAKNTESDQPTKIPEKIAQEPVCS